MAQLFGDMYPAFVVGAMVLFIIGLGAISISDAIDRKKR